MCCIISILLHLHLSPFLTATLLPLVPHAHPPPLYLYIMLLLFPYTIHSHHPAAYEVPKDNTIANLAAGYEFAAEDACEAAANKYYECADNLPESKAYDEAYDKAEAACKSEYDAAHKACEPEDDTSYDEAACNAADAKLGSCQTPFGLDDKATAADAAADAACKSEADAYVEACPEGEDDQGDSPQM